jgi:hypothetical protein
MTKNNKDKIAMANNSVLTPVDCAIICGDCQDNLIMDRRLLVRRDEFEKLQKLHENLQKRIKATKGLLALNSITKSYAEEEIAEVDDFITLLESLYNGNPQES